jgi:hypothetical protein
MNITIAIQCHNFQRRLSWMLSSILGQHQDITVAVDAMSGNGEPKTEYVTDYFRRAGMDIQFTAWNDLAEFERRGVVRTAQVQRCKTSHILFADSDMVYAPDFFEELFSEVDQNYPGMYISGRMSQETPDYANDLIRNVPALPLVKQPFELAKKLPLVKRGCVGAGFFQLVRLDACGGYYVRPEECRDWRWSDKGQKAKSDQQFRHRIGLKQRLARWFWANQIHLNHARDNQAGCHLEEQR